MSDNVEMQGLEFEIVSNTDKAVESLNKLEASLEGVKSKAKGGLGLNSVITQLSKLKESTSGMADLKKCVEGLSSLEKLGNIKISPSVAKQVKAIAEAVKCIDAESIEKLKALTGGLSELAGVSKIETPKFDLPSAPDGGEDSGKGLPVDGSIGGLLSKVESIAPLKHMLDGIKDSFAGLGKGAGQSMGAAAIAIAVFQAAVKIMVPVVKAFGKIFAKATVEIAKFLGKLAISPLVKFGNAILSAREKLNKFLHSLGRMVMYRAVRAAIRGITTALREGTQNLYQYSAAMGGTFAGSLDRLATSSLYLKNSFASIAAPLINALAPAIDMLVGKVVSLLNVFSQLIARLTGASTFSKAKKAVASYGGAVDNAAGKTAGGANKIKKSLKDLQNFTAGFDELHVFEDKDTPEDDSGADGGGAGGGGGGGVDYGSMFEEVPIDSKLAGIADEIKEMFKAQDWVGLGVFLGDCVNGAIAKIPWAAMGRKLGAGINAAFTFLYNFLKTVNFENLGSGIAEFLSNAIGSIQWRLIGATFTEGWNSLIDFVYGFINKFDWDALASAVTAGIMGFFLGIKWEKAAETLALGIKQVVGTIKKVLFETDWITMVILFTNGLNKLVTDVPWGEIGGTLGVAVNTLFTIIRTAVLNFDWIGLAKGLGEGINRFLTTTDWKAIGKTFSDSFKSVLDLLYTLIADIDWVALGAAFADLIFNVDWGGIFGEILKISIAAILGADHFIAGIFVGFFDNIICYFLEKADECGGNLILGIMKGISDAVTGISTWLLDNLVSPIVDGVKKLFGIHSPSTVFAEIGGFLIEGLLRNCY